MKERPTVKEMIEKEVNELVEYAFEAYRGPGFLEGHTTVRLRKEEETNRGLTFKTTVTVYGTDFDNFEIAKIHAKEETIRALTLLAKNRPVMVFDYDEGTTPIFDGWPGAKIPKKETWEKIYKFLGRKYGPTAEEAVRNYVLTYSNTFDKGVPFHFVLDIEYNPKVEEKVG